MPAISPIAGAPLASLVPGSTTTAMQVTQVGLEVWVSASAPITAQVTQAGLEVWVSAAAPIQAQITQAGLEVWIPSSGVAVIQNEAIVVLMRF